MDKSEPTVPRPKAGHVATQSTIMPVGQIHPDEIFSEIGDPRKRAFLIALTTTGSRTQAAAAAGVSPSATYAPAWRKDVAFQKALDEARYMAAEALEDEARRRAAQGTKQYKFTKSGDPIRHPELCECGHGVHLHPRDEVDPIHGTRPCSHPDCAESCHAFVGRPYYEHQYSDTLLKFLLQGAMPEKYSKKVELKGVLQNLDMAKLPDHVVDRIASGGNPLEIILEAAAEAGTYPGAIMGMEDELMPEDVQPDEPPEMSEYEPPDGEL